MTNFKVISRQSMQYSGTILSIATLQLEVYLTSQESDPDRCMHLEVVVLVSSVVQLIRCCILMERGNSNVGHLRL